MKAWQLYFKSKAGVVIFINGNEVYRDYLPAGEISSSTVRRLKAGESVSTNTLDALCRILDCTLQDIVEYLPDKQ